MRVSLPYQHNSISDDPDLTIYLIHYSSRPILDRDNFCYVMVNNQNDFIDYLLAIELDHRSIQTVAEP